MAESEDVRIPTVTAEDRDMKTATVKILLPGLTIVKSMGLFGTQKPSKNCSVDVKLEESSVELTADIKNKNGKSTRFHYKANKLPEKINTAESKIMFEKNTVKLTLVKQEELSWEVKLSKNGLDQDPNAEQ